MIKEVIEEFFKKMTIDGVDVQVAESAEAIEVNLTLNEPQFLIGQNGETLSDLGRVLNIILTKKLGKSFYLKLDINDYKKKKVEYLKNLANELADEVVKTGEKKVLLPMSAYERMVIHSELAPRKDVATESQGEGVERCVVIRLVI